jgi:arsenite transporter
MNQAVAARRVLLRSFLLRRHGQAWFEGVLLPKFAPVTIAVLLATQVLIFASQADHIMGRFLHVVPIAVPITL